MAPITARGRRRQRGFGMLLALTCVALVGIYLMAVGEVWSTHMQRVREDELLRKGDAIRRAISDFVKADQGGAYPMNFNELLRDPRAGFVRRFLRDAYQDPMTNADWQVIRGPAGEMYGVYSASTEKPLKKDGFSDDDAGFALQSTYQDWKFTYYPQRGMNRR